MQPVLTAEEMREVDRSAAAAGVPPSQLVERAGTAVASAAVEMLDGAYGKRVLVVAGPGNNGADGKVAARILRRRGATVDVVAASAHGEPGVRGTDSEPGADGARGTDGKPSADRVRTPLPHSDLVIDAAFGTGFRGDYCAPSTGGAAVLAVDLPTGVDADTGEAGDGAVHATRTVVLGAWKPGLLLGPGRARAGRASIHRIGLPVPPTDECMICLVDDGDIAALVPGRTSESHKWQTALSVVAGSPGMYGAPTFVSHAAARAGAGMVRLGVPGAETGDLPVSEAVSQALPLVGFDETVLDGLERCRALVVGPGLGRSDETRAAVRRLVAKAPVPVLIDADGLYALGDADSARAIIGGRGHPTVLTPHDGEFAHLSGSSPGRDRIASVRQLAAATGAIVLLKGSTTVIASPDGRVLLSASGSSRLATAGSGDVLSGVIGALLARGTSAAGAAAIGAHVHGRAAARGHAVGLIASDLADLVADVLSDARADEDG